MISEGKAAFLYSLEPELFSSSDLVSEAILVSALFCRQVCLTEAQVFVTEGVRAFCRDNESALTEMLQRDEVPILGMALRRPESVWNTLDLRLEPKGEMGYPSYDNSLPPSENRILRNGYRRLKTPAGRRRRFLEVAGEEAKLHLERVQRYITHNPSTTTIPPNRLGEQLFDSTKKEIAQLLDSPNAVVQDVDHRIADSVIDRIEKHPKTEAQTREALHWAVYGGLPPGVHHGVVKWSEHPGTPDPVKDEWRFFLNSIYNYNLAKKLDLQPVLNSNWWTIGRRWFSEETVRQRLKLEPAGTLPLSSCLYRRYLDITFVRNSRRNPAFWKSLSELERARVGRDGATWHRCYRDHLQLLSEEFARHLVDMGKRKLVARTLREFTVPAVHIGGALAGPVVTLLAYVMGQPPDSAMEFGTRALAQGEAIAFSIQGLFYATPSAANVRLMRPGFKSVIAEIGEASGVPKEIKECA